MMNNFMGEKQPLFQAKDNTDKSEKKFLYKYSEKYHRFEKCETADENENIEEVTRGILPKKEFDVIIDDLSRIVAQGFFKKKEVGSKIIHLFFPNFSEGTFTDA